MEGSNDNDKKSEDWYAPPKQWLFRHEEQDEQKMEVEEDPHFTPITIKLRGASGE